MSSWNGRAYKGAMRDRRVQKREEAEARNKLTPFGRTAEARRQHFAEVRASYGNGMGQA